MGDGWPDSFNALCPLLFLRKNKYLIILVQSEEIPHSTERLKDGETNPLVYYLTPSIPLQLCWIKSMSLSVKNICNTDTTWIHSTEKWIMCLNFKTNILTYPVPWYIYVHINLLCNEILFPKFINKIFWFFCKFTGIIAGFKYNRIHIYFYWNKDAKHFVGYVTFIGFNHLFHFISQKYQIYYIQFLNFDTYHANVAF